MLSRVLLKSWSGGQGPSGFFRSNSSVWTPLVVPVECVFYSSFRTGLDGALVLRAVTQLFFLRKDVQESSWNSLGSSSFLKMEADLHSQPFSGKIISWVRQQIRAQFIAGHKLWVRCEFPLWSLSLFIWDVMFAQAAVTHEIQMDSFWNWSFTVYSEVESVQVCRTGLFWVVYGDDVNINTSIFVPEECQWRTLDVRWGHSHVSVLKLQ